MKVKVCQIPGASVADRHKQNNQEEQKCIFARSWKLKVLNELHWGQSQGVGRGPGGASIPCSFPHPRLPANLRLWPQPSYPPVRICPALFTSLSPLCAVMSHPTSLVTVRFIQSHLHHPGSSRDLSTPAETVGRDHGFLGLEGRYLSGARASQVAQ